MTKAEELNITNLIHNVRKMEDAVKNNNNEVEIAKIRQYCIDAIRDYNETNKKICYLINANRDLWKNPYIKGSNDGFVNDKPYWLNEHDYICTPSFFTFNKGMFNITDAMNVCVSGISGNKQRTGYCGHYEDHDIISKDWKADSVVLEDEYCSKDMPWCKDLISGTFEIRDVDGCVIEHSVHYTEENLKKFNWTIDGWIDLKDKANKTRMRTEALINKFKSVFENRISEYTVKLNNLTKMSESCEYQKVGF